MVLGTLLSSCKGHGAGLSTQRSPANRLQLQAERVESDLYFHNEGAIVGLQLTVGFHTAVDGGNGSQRIEGWLAHRTPIGRGKFRTLQDRKLTSTGAAERNPGVEIARPRQHSFLIGSLRTAHRQPEILLPSLNSTNTFAHVPGNFLPRGQHGRMRISTGSGVHLRSDQGNLGVQCTGLRRLRRFYSA